jgi:SAM-dependent methyltransferase
MAFPPSLVRLGEHEVMRKITLHGEVIDLGGGKDSGYRTLFSGTYRITSANLDGHTTTDIHCDLEKPLPMSDASYDGVLLINTLEHIYHAQELVRESFRIARSGATIVIAVPFLFPVHPSPKDYWRFTNDTLTDMLTDAGFRDVVVTPVAYGVFTNRFVLLERVLPQPLRLIMYYLGAPLAEGFDILFYRTTSLLKRPYNPTHYATGYVAVGKK